MHTLVPISAGYERVWSGSVVKVQNWRWGNATFRFGPLTMVVSLSLAL